MKANFLQNMVEDRTESALSYYEFLLHIQQQVNKRFLVLIITINIILLQKSQFFILAIPKSARKRSHIAETNYLVKIIFKNCTEMVLH